MKRMQDGRMTSLLVECLKWFRLRRKTRNGCPVSEVVIQEKIEHFLCDCSANVADSSVWPKRANVSIWAAPDGRVLLICNHDSRFIFDFGPDGSSFSLGILREWVLSLPVVHN